MSKMQLALVALMRQKSIQFLKKWSKVCILFSAFDIAEELMLDHKTILTH